MTATATFSRLVPAAALTAALAVAGCGGAARPRSASPFAWLRPAAAPAGWNVGHLPSGAASFAYPPGWKAIATDPGTFSAALIGANHRIRGYLNATPQSGGETLANWGTFRVAHNGEEGDRHVVRESTARGLHFRSGIGSCVTDRYSTTTGAHYREIACIVSGPHGATVIVAAAPPSEWRHFEPQLRRSVASFG